MERVYKAIEKLMSEKDRVIVAIDGMCGSGKTTFSKHLEEKYDATVFQMDWFYLPIEQKTPERMSEPGCNVDYDRVLSEIHEKLDQDKVSYKRYSDITLEYYPMEKELKKLVIIEGAYSMRPEFRKYYDLKIFLGIDPSHQIERLTKREGIEGVKDYIKKWIPLENEYIDHYNLKEACDVVLEAQDAALF
ncbi:uridine kinase [Mycoplasmatota bacterium]|nr:uridine kinase [Mycoplasmatota bacterium]